MKGEESLYAWKSVIILTLILVLAGCLSAPANQNNSTNGSVGGNLNNSTVPQQATNTASSETGTFDRDEVEQKVHEYINKKRAERGLPKLRHDSELRKIARSYSKEMATRGFFSHYTPEGDNFTDRYREAGYDCEVIKERQGRSTTYATGGENIAKTYWEREVEAISGNTEYYDSNEELARGLVNEWMNSTGHRENLLEPYWQNEGIGIHKDGYEVYATQNFC